MNDAAKEAAVLLYSPGTDTFLEDMTRNADDYSISMRGQELAYFESLSKSAEEPDHPGGLDMIKLPWKRGARSLEPKIMVNPRLLELQTAKQILEEVFNARPADVEEMIQMRLEEKNWSKESWQEEEEMWPREFCLGE